jgi:predicted enzyme related to lactoylglutathione lyase
MTRATATKPPPAAPRRAARRPTVHVSIDVPSLADALPFYEAVFGFVERARPFPTMAILEGHPLSVCLHERAEGTVPAPKTPDRRRYQRHWTPVHLDLHVEDFDERLERIRAAGGVVEAELRGQGPRPVAFCADPFGNGFCVLGAPRPSTRRRTRG